MMALALGISWVGAADGPFPFIDQHVDLWVRYDGTSPQLLDMLVANEDARPVQVFDATNCVLVVAEEARLALPSDLPPLGAAGDPLWVLPASQEEGLLYLGISGGGTPAGVLAEPFRIRLVGFEGPGHFFLWQAELGELTFQMNTRDGLGMDDLFTQPVGAHSHVNWGFTTSGVYRVTLQAESRRVGETTNIFSLLRTFTFHVQPLPPATETPFGRWQERYWPGISDPAVIGEKADPDGDGQANLWEYVLGTNPAVPDDPPMGVPQLALVGEGEAIRASIAAARVATAVDAEFRLWTADRVGTGWSVSEVSPTIGGPVDGWVWVTFVDPRPVKERRECFYRVEVRLKTGP